MKSIRLCIIALAFVAFLGCACTSARIVTGSALLSQVPTSQPAPAASGFPRGRFSAVSQPNMLILAIENDGSFRVYTDGDMLDSGKFDVSGPRVLVESMACAEQSTQAARPAAYEWAYDEEHILAFLPTLADPCLQRRQYLASQYQPKYLFVFNVPDRGVSKDWLW